MPLAPLPTIVVEPLVREALLEDLGRAGDLTTDAIVPRELEAEDRHGRPAGRTSSPASTSPRSPSA